MPAEPPRFVLATPQRTAADNHARALEQRGLLRALYLGTRRGTEGVPPERTHLQPAIGLVNYAAAQVLSTTQAETVRFALDPWFDAWVTRNLRPGEHLFSSYGYTNRAFRRVRQEGGRTLIDGGNSHPEHFWALLTEEHRRWHCPDPPVSRFHQRRNLEMMEHLDYVCAPSEFVARSFRERGFSPERILSTPYPVDLRLFTPAAAQRPRERPLTVISTGMLSLRKGTPYLLEAFRLIRRQVPDARFLLTQAVLDNARPILARYADLPIEWSPTLPHPQLAERLRSADVFVLPSLEEGFVRTAAEALACGLPAVLTPNTGVNDFITPGVNGSIVPIRDATAIAEAVLAWWERLRTEAAPPQRKIDPVQLSYETFAANFLAQLESRKLVPAR